MGMGLGKQAKILTKGQGDAVLAYLSTTRYPDRNRVIFLLSIKAGLRAKEIACLQWSMVNDVEGRLTDTIHLPNAASKGRSGRIIPLSRDLKAALKGLAASEGIKSLFVVTTERATRTSAAAIVNLFRVWYVALGLEGASSHSGRRTAITNWARKISTVGGSLRDVQVLAGHSALTTTQRYIEAHADAQNRVVELAL
jgi:integrase